MDRSRPSRFDRRHMLRVTSLGAGAVLLGAAGRTGVRAQEATPSANVFDPSVCYTPLEGSESVQYDAVGESGFNIGLSNSYIGNVWRTQMLQMAQAYVTSADIAPLISTFQVNSSGTDDNAQNAQIDDMISNGAQAIVTIANSTGGQVNTLEQARADGIVVVAFDNIFESDNLVFVNQDQLEMGRRWAQFLVDNNAGSGPVLMVNGVAGTSVDNDRRAGAYEIFDAEGVEYVEVIGEWDPGLAQTATASALASNPNITGIWCQGGTNGSVQALLDAGRDLVPVAGEGENGFHKQMLEYEFPGYSISQTPGMGCVAIRVALDLLMGNAVPSFVGLPLPEVTNDTLEVGVNVFPDITDNFFTANSIAGCGIDLTYEEISSQEI